MSLVTVLNLPSLARASYSSGQLPVATQFGILSLIDIDINVTAITGGASPTVTFKFSRVGADGILYQLWQPTPLSAPGTFSQSIGNGAQTNEDLGELFQIDMITTGNPTSVTFSLSLTGRASLVI